MTELEWREQLKAGDEVIIDGGSQNRLELSTVLRVTKTQIIIRYGRSEQPYRKKDGFQVASDGWYRRYIVMPTVEAKELILLDRLAYRARCAKDAAVIPKTRPELEHFIAVLSQFAPKPEGK